MTPKDTQPMTFLRIRVKISQKQALQEIANRENLDLSDIVRRALAEFLKKEELGQKQ